jgi:hypothetical protein
MKDFIFALGQVFSDPDSVVIIRRVLCVIFSGLGMRTALRWYWYLRKALKLEKKSVTIAQIRDRSKHVVVPTQFFISFIIAWVYRWDIVKSKIFDPDTGRIISADVLNYVSWERMIAEGFLYAIGSIGLYLGFMVCMRVLEKKAKIKILD